MLIAALPGRCLQAPLPSPHYLSTYSTAFLTPYSAAYLPPLLSCCLPVCGALHGADILRLNVLHKLKCGSAAQYPSLSPSLSLLHTPLPSLHTPLFLYHVQLLVQFVAAAFFSWRLISLDKQTLHFL